MPQAGHTLVCAIKPAARMQAPAAKPPPPPPLGGALANPLVVGLLFVIAVVLPFLAIFVLPAALVGLALILSRGSPPAVVHGGDDDAAQEEVRPLLASEVDGSTASSHARVSFVSVHACTCIAWPGAWTGRSCIVRGSRRRPERCTAHTAAPRCSLLLKAWVGLHAPLHEQCMGKMQKCGVR